MAKSAPNTQFPVDGRFPSTVEADSEGFDQVRGFGLEVGGESPVGAAKGDRVRQGVPGPSYLDEELPIKR